MSFSTAKAKDSFTLNQAKVLASLIEDSRHGLKDVSFLPSEVGSGWCVGATDQDGVVLLFHGMHEFETWWREVSFVDTIPHQI